MYHCTVYTSVCKCNKAEEYSGVWLGGCIANSIFTGIYMSLQLFSASGSWLHIQYIVDDYTVMHVFDSQIL